MFSYLLGVFFKTIPELFFYVFFVIFGDSEGPLGFHFGFEVIFRSELRN